MKSIRSLAPLPAFLLATGLPLGAAVLENWQFDETSGTPLSGLVNDAGSAMFGADVANLLTDGSGNLLFTVSLDDPETPESDESTSNVFRVAELTAPDLGSGKVELSFTYTSADLSGGDVTGANVGFSLRDYGADNLAGGSDADADTDLFLVRLQKQNGTLRLQHRIGSTNTDLENFGVDVLPGPLAVRAIADLDLGTLAVFWTVDGGSERCSTNIPFAATGLNVDAIRLVGNTNATDWGASDAVAVDFLTLSTYTDPPSVPAIENWQFNDEAGANFNTVANDAGSATLGGAAANAVTDGAGSMVFSVGADASDNIFRNGELTVPDQTTGRFEMEWFVTSATLDTGDAAGANLGFGMRDADTNSDLFVVRLQKQNDTLRLQHRVGSTNTDLENFGVAAISDLWVKVVADLDADTFSVYWQLGDGTGSCSTDIPMSAPDLDFDYVRTLANTNTDDWGASDTVSIDYLTVRKLDVAPTALSLTAVPGPASGQVTLVWPVSTPANAILESSNTLAAPWTEITETPTVDGDQYELVITIGETKEFFRLRTP